MKDLKTIVLTVGIGSAMAFLLSKKAGRKEVSSIRKKIKKIINPHGNFFDDDNSMRYI